jgi:hypothetical protein
MNELLQGKATIRSVGEDRAWHVSLNFQKSKSSFLMRAGWKSFSKEHELKVGDVCKFEMTQREPLSFTITIIPTTKEPGPEKFQGIAFVIVVFEMIHILLSSDFDFDTFDQC